MVLSQLEEYSVMYKPFQQLTQMQDMIRHFTPNWFTVTMGTGVVALILAELPVAESLMWSLGAMLWQINILLFLLFGTLYGLRWMLFPTEAKKIFKHPMMGLFLGAIPMGLATILNGFLKFGITLYGDIALNIAQSLWYVDVALAVMIAWIVPFTMYSQQKHELKTMSAVWLLPVKLLQVQGGCCLHRSKQVKTPWLFF